MLVCNYFRIESFGNQMSLLRLGIHNFLSPYHTVSISFPFRGCWKRLFAGRRIFPSCILHALGNLPEKQTKRQKKKQKTWRSFIPTSPLTSYWDGGKHPLLITSCCCLASTQPGAAVMPYFWTLIQVLPQQQVCEWNKWWCRGSNKNECPLYPALLLQLASSIFIHPILNRKKKSRICHPVHISHRNLTLSMTAFKLAAIYMSCVSLWVAGGWSGGICVAC